MGGAGAGLGVINNWSCVTFLGIKGLNSPVA